MIIDDEKENTVSYHTILHNAVYHVTNINSIPPRVSVWVKAGQNIYDEDLFTRFSGIQHPVRNGSRRFGWWFCLLDDTQVWERIQKKPGCTTDPAVIPDLSWRYQNQCIRRLVLIQLFSCWKGNTWISIHVSGSHFVMIYNFDLNVRHGTNPFNTNSLFSKPFNRVRIESTKSCSK